MKKVNLLIGTAISVITAPSAMSMEVYNSMPLYESSPYLGHYAPLSHSNRSTLESVKSVQPDLKKKGSQAVVADRETINIQNGILNSLKTAQDDQKKRAAQNTLETIDIQRAMLKSFKTAQKEQKKRALQSVVADEQTINLQKAILASLKTFREEEKKREAQTVVGDQETINIQNGILNSLTTHAAEKKARQAKKLERVLALAIKKAMSRASKSVNLPIQAVKVEAAELAAASLPHTQTVKLEAAELAAAKLPQTQTVKLEAAELAAAKLPQTQTVKLEAAELAAAKLPQVQTVKLEAAELATAKLPQAQGIMAELDALLDQVDTSLDAVLEIAQKALADDEVRRAQEGDAAFNKLFESLVKADEDAQRAKGEDAFNKLFESLERLDEKSQDVKGEDAFDNLFQSLSELEGKAEFDKLYEDLLLDRMEQKEAKRRLEPAQLAELQGYLAIDDEGDPIFMYQKDQNNGIIAGGEFIHDGYISGLYGIDLSELDLGSLKAGDKLNVQVQIPATNADEATVVSILDQKIQDAKGEINDILDVNENEIIIDDYGYDLTASELFQLDVRDSINLNDSEVDISEILEALHANPALAEEFPVLAAFINRGNPQIQTVKLAENQELGAAKMPMIQQIKLEPTEVSAAKLPTVQTVKIEEDAELARAIFISDEEIAEIDAILAEVSPKGPKVKVDDSVRAQRNAEIDQLISEIEMEEVDEILAQYSNKKEASVLDQSTQIKTRAAIDQLYADFIEGNGSAKNEAKPFLGDIKNGVQLKAAGHLMNANRPVNELTKHLNAIKNRSGNPLRHVEFKEPESSIPLGKEISMEVAAGKPQFKAGAAVKAAQKHETTRNQLNSEGQRNQANVIEKLKRIAIKGATQATNWIQNLQDRKEDRLAQINNLENKRAQIETGINGFRGIVSDN